MKRGMATWYMELKRLLFYTVIPLTGIMQKITKYYNDL